MTKKLNELTYILVWLVMKLYVSIVEAQRLPDWPWKTESRKSAETRTINVQIIFLITGDWSKST